MNRPVDFNPAERSPAGRTARKPRPAWMSRRQKRKQYGFETLEDRRVMSADSPLPVFQNASSDTLEGQFQIAMQEAYWQSLFDASVADSANVGPVAASIPTDPLLPMQWHLINTGQRVSNIDSQAIFGVPGEDINVAAAWNRGYTGEGVVVAVIDTGVQTNHPDLAANIHPTLGFDALNPGGDGNPQVTFFDQAHGTAVAGLIAAVANNGIGGTGVAPDATIVPIRLLGQGPFLPEATADAYRYAWDQIDITNASLQGAVPRSLFPISNIELAAIRDSITFGRDGLGTIHVRSAGNNAGPAFATGFSSIGSWDSAAYDGFANTRYFIAVTATDHDGGYNNFDGTVTAYPEVSAAVLVAAPTGSNASNVITDDRALGSGLTTTDLTGEDGFNAGPNEETGLETEDPAFPFDRDFLENTDFTSRFNGTSAAAPIVSGVIALMLEANPNLSWRDVQEILVRSARQNAQHEVPLNGLGQATGFGTQNTWITNQTPIFHDPDPFTGNPALDTFIPTWDPNVGGAFAGPFDPVDTNAIRLVLANSIGPNNVILNTIPDHYQPTPHAYTNGAGYTVSQGSGYYAGDQVGYGHGMVDAEMAVLLAEQWHTKGQNLAAERTFTSFVNPAFNTIPIPAAEQSDMDSGFQIVPGGLGGDAGYVSYWNEYFTDDAFQDPDETFPYRGFPYVPFSVPDNQVMSVESVEVKVSISGGTAEALDHLRLMLISPDGTQSELNHFWVDPPPNVINMQNLSPAIVVGEPGSQDNGGDLVWTFNTKRSWGERSDDRIVFDPSTGEPVVITNAGGLGIAPADDFGTALENGWKLVIENYNFATGFNLQGVEVAWHGTPVGANTERIQGLVGVDDNEDDLFNFNRVNSEVVGTPGALRYGEMFNSDDLTQESFAGNVTVTVRRQDNNQVVDQFVTGADGNFFFDLVPDDYTISVEDPEGRVALDDSTTGDQFLDHYRSEWVISEDYFKVWDFDPNDPTEAIVDANGDPLAWLDGNGQEATYGMRGINFLLDPGPVVAPEAVFTGFVFADINGDGVYNRDDVGVPDAGVFGDVNRNGQFDPGEILVETNADGQYTLVVPVSASSVIDVGVVAPPLWVATNPSAGVESFFAEQGDQFDNVDFALTPPPGTTQGDFSSEGRYILGAVFVDANNNGQRDAGEVNAPGFRVYIDANNNAIFDSGDTDVTTNVNGAFAFSDMPAGTNVVRIELSGTVHQTRPVLDRPFVVEVPGNGTLNGMLFGIRDTSTLGGAGSLDYGDLPNDYGATTLADNGARHPRSDWFLGARFDGEINGLPSVGADGDDLDPLGGLDDEDGISFNTLALGTNTITVTASRHGGYLQGWMDLNGDKDFDDFGERIIRNELLDAGENSVTFQIPGVTTTTVYARFRYGDFSIDPATGLTKPVDTIFGLAKIGEVEDYAIPYTGPLAPLNMEEAADFDGDDHVSGSDFLAWQRGYGKTGNAVAADGDADRDGDVDGDDMHIWEVGFAMSAGATQSAGLAATSPAAAGSQPDGGVGQSELSLWDSESASAPMIRGELRVASELSAAASTFVADATTSTVRTAPTASDVSLVHRARFSPTSRRGLGGALDAATQSEAEALANLQAALEASPVGQSDRVFDRFSEHDDLDSLAERLADGEGDLAERDDLFAAIGAETLGPGA